MNEWVGFDEWVKDGKLNRWLDNWKNKWMGGFVHG